MPNLLSLIGESWDFCRRQQAVIPVGFWFLFLPALGSSLLLDYMLIHQEELRLETELQVMSALALLALSLVMAWGAVCMLMIGKRLLQAKAGRTRTSFKAVRTQAAHAYIPYLLTSILRFAITFLWSLLLIVPGIIYGVRTVFYPVIVVCEGKAYRDALRHSADVVKGQFWPVLGTLLALGIMILVPAHLLSAIFDAMAEGAPLPILAAADIASSIITTISVTVYTFSLILAYDHFRPASHSHN